MTGSNSITDKQAQFALWLLVAAVFVVSLDSRVITPLLPAIAERVDGAVPILLDGGIRRGTDVLKALALGASAVLIGQPIMTALAVAGPVGVLHLLTILRAELEVAMALTGCASIDRIDRRVLAGAG